MVIAVIGILAALLLPALHRAKLKAQAVGCLGNLRQIGLGYRMAVDDSAGVLDQMANAMYPDTNSSEQAIASWWASNCGRPEKGWICPSAPLTPQPPYPAPAGTISWGGTVTAAWLGFGWGALDGHGGLVPNPPMIEGSYTQNGWLFGWTDAPFAAGVRPFRTEGEVARPLLTPVLADGTEIGGDPLASDLPPTDLRGIMPSDPYDGWGSIWPFIIPRHGSRPEPVPSYWPQSRPLPGAINAAFFDGHAQAVKLDYLWQLYWSYNYVPPAKRPGLP